MGLAGNKLSESDRIDIALSLFEVKDQDNNKGEIHGLCPFHEDQHTSFSYNYRKDAYHCLAGCGDGDLIKVFSFRLAAEKLSERGFVNGHIN